MAKKAAKKAAKSRQASALSPQGDRRRADERAAARAARRDLFRAARHPQEAHRAVPDLAERAGARPSRAGARRARALQDLAVAAAVGDRDPRHRATLEGALRVVRACADGGKGRREAADRQGRSRPAARRSRRRRTSSRSSISSRRSTRPGASATKPTSACTAFLGDAGVVELVGICGYYAMISMTLNVFRAQDSGRRAAAVQGAVSRCRDAHG